MTFPKLEKSLFSVLFCDFIFVYLKIKYFRCVQTTEKTFKYLRKLQISAYKVTRQVLRKLAGCLAGAEEGCAGSYGGGGETVVAELA